MNRLENLKADNFRYFSNYEWLPNWEDFLTSDYWKFWQTKIPVFQNEKELIFYTQRLGEIASLISRCRKYGTREEENADLLLIKQEETRLQSISQEDWKKECKFADVEFKELSVEEMKNDPWFSKQLGFDSESKQEKQEENPNKEDDRNVDYKTWTKDQLISEINRLKTENEQLKNNRTLTSSEQRERLRKNQERLNELSSYYDTSSSQLNNSNNKFPTGWIISGTILLAIGGLLTVLIYKNKKSKK